MGLPQGMISQFLKWGSGLLHPGSAEQLRECTLAATSYLGEEIEKRRQSPTEDIMTYGIRAEVDGKRLSEGDLLGFLFGLFLAGIDTVSTAIAFQLLHLARVPSHQRILREKPDLIPGAVDELMRAYGPTINFRTCRKQIEMRGVTIMPGDKVVLSTALAGRDPAEYERPNEIRFSRKAHHVSFAYGPHSCVGMHLARLELRTALSVVLTTLPEFHLRPNAVLKYSAHLVMQPTICLWSGKSRNGVGCNAGWRAAAPWEGILYATGITSAVRLANERGASRAVESHYFRGDFSGLSVSGGRRMPSSTGTLASPMRSWTLWRRRQRGSSPREGSAEAIEWRYLPMRGPEVVVVFLACARMGAIYLGLSPRLSPPELAYVLKDAQPAHIFSIAHLDGRDLGQLIRNVSTELGGAEPIIISTSSSALSPDFLSLVGESAPDAPPCLGGKSKIRWRSSIRPAQPVRPKALCCRMGVWASQRKRTLKRPACASPGLFRNYRLITWDSCFAR